MSPLAERWDGLQDEVKPSCGGISMFNPLERKRQALRDAG
ncbi:hypothetical protein ABIC03_000580 [Bradyrhizobium sp. RT6a]